MDVQENTVVPGSSVSVSPVAAPAAPAAPAVATAAASVSQSPAAAAHVAEVVVENAVADAMAPAKPEKRVSGFISKTEYRLYDPTNYEGNPFEVDGSVVGELIIKKLRPMELTGIKIESIATRDIEVMVELLQRSTSIHLSDEDVNNLDLAVITEASGVFMGFFMGTPSVMSGN